MLKLNHIDHLNLNVLNLKKTSGFYQKIFGLKVFERGFNSSGSPYEIIGSPDSLFLCLYEAKEIQVKVGMNHFGAHIKNDFNQLIDYLHSENINVLYGGPIQYEHSRSLYIQDPDGREIELTEKFGGGFKHEDAISA